MISRNTNVIVLTTSLETIAIMGQTATPKLRPIGVKMEESAGNVKFIIVNYYINGHDLRMF